MDDTCVIGYVVTTPFGVCMVTEEVSLFVMEPLTSGLPTALPGPRWAVVYRAITLRRPPMPPSA